MSTGSVTGAARLLNISQPAVSKTLRHAELQLGFALFERDRGRLRPTDEALSLYAEIVKIHPQISAVQRLAENLRRGTGRGLHILTLPALAQTLIPRAIAQFRASYPDCEISVRAGHSRDIITALLLREADIAFDFGVMNHPAIRRTALVDAELVCIAPRGLFREDAPVRVDALAGKSVIRLAQDDPFGERVFKKATALGKSQSGTVTVDTYHSALALATAGVGAALIDPFTASSRNTEAVTAHRLTPPISFSLSWYTSPDHPPNIMMRQLVERVGDTARKMLKPFRFN
jgi:DNA-binding transcriptional LysR family regulator